MAQYVSLKCRCDQQVQYGMDLNCRSINKIFGPIARFSYADTPV